MKRPFLLCLSLCATAANATPKAQPPHFEPKAHALLKKVFDYYRALKSYSGAMKWHRSGDALDAFDAMVSDGKSQIRFAPPRLYVRSKVKGGQWEMRFVDDGKKVYINAMPDDVYRLSRDFAPQDELWKFIHATEFGVRPLLQNTNPLQPFGSYVRSIAEGEGERKGEAHIVVRLEAPKSTAQIDYFVGESDLSVRAVRVHQVVNGKTLDTSEEHSDIKLNPAIPSSELEPDAEMKRLAIQAEADAEAKRKAKAGEKNTPRE